MPSPAPGSRPLAASGGHRPTSAPAPAASGSASPSTTARSPFVTLQPAGPGGHTAGTAEDGADFYGLGAAVVAIVLCVVLAKLAFRHRGPGRGPSQGER